MFDALYDADDINFIGIHDERTGTHMADGYARASGRQALLCWPEWSRGDQSCHRSCYGESGLLASGVDCWCAVERHQYRDAFQEVDQQVFTPVTSLDSAKCRACSRTFREAFRLTDASYGTGGPDLPRDVLAAQIDAPDFREPHQYRTTSRPAGAASEIAAAAALLGGAHVIIVGWHKEYGRGGCCAGACHGINAPLVAAPGHGDAISYGHPLNAGQMGRGQCGCITTGP